MATQLDYILQAFTMYVDGFGKAGSGEECALPKMRKQTESFRGGGMLGARKIALGYQDMEFDFNLSSFDPQVLSKGGLSIGAKGLAFSVRAYLDGDNNSRHTAICQMRGEVIELDPGRWQAGKKAMLNNKVALDATKLIIDGATIWDIDLENGTYEVGGSDPYVAVAAALGF